MAAFAAILFWSLALAAMWLLTANPLLVSRDQVLQSDAVVTARLDGAGRGRLRIESVLSGNLAQDDVVTVLNLPPHPELEAGRACVVPLQRFRRDYQVTVLEGQRSPPLPPLVYPATPEAIREVNRILREANQQ